jgi:hypothetical protein
MTDIGIGELAIWLVLVTAFVAIGVAIVRIGFRRR